MGKFSRFGSALYSGRRSINFVGRRWLWYALSGVIVIVAILGLSFKGLDLGIDFTGGTSYTVTVSGQASQTMADNLRTTVADTGFPAAEDPLVTTSGQHDLIVQIKSVNQSQNATIIADIAKAAGVQPKNVSQDQVGASWGSEVAHKAITALIIFLVLVVLFIWIYFREWKMSVAALVALAHDVVIAVGVYALSGFEVTPATVTGFLTILGFSLYDTVVVFDKVRENTVPAKLRSSKKGYAEAANLALNQTLVRSINTSLVSLLPVAAILYVSAVQLGASTLKDLALALFVGMAAGTYSSIFIATPLLVHLKQGEKEVQAGERRARTAREVDPYASVPAYTEDMPVTETDEFADDDDDDRPASRQAPTRPQRPRASGSGRAVPPSRGPVQEGGAAGRPQPSRKPRSKRK